MDYANREDQCIVHSATCAVLVHRTLVHRLKFLTNLNINPGYVVNRVYIKITIFV